MCEALARSGAQRVVGIDRAPGYVDHAASLVGRTHPQVTFKVGDAMQLPFPDNTFDAAVSGLVLNFVPDASIMVREMRRVARPGGIVAAYVWDYAERMELLRRFWDAAVALDPAAVKLDERLRFPICNPAALEKGFRNAPLSAVKTSHLDLPIVFRDFEDYWTPFLGGQGPSGGYAMSLSEESRSRLRERLRSTLSAKPDGTIPMTLRAWTVKGAKRT